MNDVLPAAAPAPASRGPAPCTDAERRDVRRFGTAIVVRAWIGTALWVAVHQNLPMTLVLVASCWGPWLLVRRGDAAAERDRDQARGHIANASLVVLLATAAWTLWGLVLAGRGRDVGGWALAALWTFLFLCFVVDFWLFRWGMRAVPASGGADPGISAEEALRAEERRAR